jgi:hypothetical protein
MALTVFGSASTVSFAAEFNKISIIFLNRHFLIFDNQISNDIKGNVIAGVNIQYKQILINIVAIVENDFGTTSEVERIIIFFMTKPDGKLANKSWLYISSLFQFDVKVAIEEIVA